MIDSSLTHEIKMIKDSYGKRIEVLEIKSNNYESLLSMQGAFYQSLIAILIFVFGFGGWAFVNKQIKKVRIDNDERVKALRTVLSMTLGDVNNILGNHSYDSKDYYVSFRSILQGAKYMLESLNIYNDKKSIMNFLEDVTKDKNIRGLTGKLILDLEQIEYILKNHILKGEFDKEIADDYTEITMNLDDLRKCSNSLISEKSKTIFDFIVKYVYDKQLLNT
ncbi:MAG: hypothetical protein IPK11_14485 [Ignavibacteria bacterium]|nr:hypothetical protein [Ignavibacteria bacterium]